MLAADKDRLIANVKQTALQLRHKELDYYVERYSNLATQASILSGFAFDGLVELDTSKATTNPHAPWVETVFYAAGACTMACALYTLCVASFAVVYGHRLALQGPTGSVDRAVAVMMKSRASIFASFALAMLSLMIAACAMAWIKMGVAAAGVTGVFALLAILLLWKHQEMKYSFRIDPELMVRGDVRLQVGVTDVDVASLEAGYGGPSFADASLNSSSNGSPRLNGRLDGGAGVGSPPPSSSTGRQPLLR